jgi:hypothetical protein
MPRAGRYCISVLLFRNLSSILAFLFCTLELFYVWQKGAYTWEGLFVRVDSMKDIAQDSISLTPF